ncbi:Uncharacterized protein TCM_042301 [Theobroma cacao]|uniref:Uncharacterized protein n=1 Tax=Theobroma cacao TaxID=3641 RepID=A0A061GZ86_THECC|nr:Uncharacterized protein TCM_042301 [Theobroma cacao]
MYFVSIWKLNIQTDTCVFIICMYGDGNHSAAAKRGGLYSMMSSSPQCNAVLSLRVETAITNQAIWSRSRRVVGCRRRWRNVPHIPNHVDEIVQKTSQSQA